MDASAWASISPYLDQVLDLEPAERAIWLEELETTQAEVARTLRELLADRDALNARDFLEGAPLPLTRLDTLMPVLEEALRERHQQDGISAGAMLGPYQLLREIGHGGMSSVWLAERCDGQFNREVALKVPFVGPHHAQMAERFRRERDILAALTHPNIARLYDAGIGASGQSYLAMEYVSGTALTSYCDTEQLTVRDRLTLFLQVLAAVEFAHTHLVLHRDLKPSNIQVTAERRVVLLDFGIAKLLSPEAPVDSPPTEMAARMLTPDYASPEHIAGGALGTTSDVYSLGVVLFELLAGSRPFGGYESRRELEEAILKQAAPRPSQLAFTNETAAARNTTPRKLAQLLRGDLDTIVLKALKKAPSERYRSVDAFARDIANYLAGRPVSARPDSAWYRTRRFVSRHKWQVGASLVTALSIVAGAGAALWQAQETAQQRDRALTLASRNRAINDFTSMLIGEAASSERPVTVKEMLARSESLALAGTAGNSEDRAVILETLALLHYNTSDDVGKSAELLERALVLVADSRDNGLRARLTCRHAMMIADMGKIDVAIGEINSELAKLQSDHQNASVCLTNLVQITQRAGGDAQAALRYATAALERFRLTEIKAPADEAELLGAVAYGHNLQGDTVRADRYYQQALQKFAEAGRERSPAATVVLHNWAIVSTTAGVPKRALELYDQVLGIVRERDPDAALPAALVYNRGRALERIGRYAQARDAYELGRRLGERARNSNMEASCLLGLALVAENSGDRSAARRYLGEAAQLLGPSLSNYRPLMARQAIVLGRLAFADGKLDEARAQFAAVLARKRKNDIAIDAALGKSQLELSVGNMAAAADDARIALDIALSMQGGIPHSNFTGLSQLMLGRVLLARGETEPAHRAFESAVTHLSSTVDANHPALIQARELLAATAKMNRH